VVSGVRRMNEKLMLTLQTLAGEEGSSGPVSTWMGDRLRAGMPSRYVTSQLGQLSLAYDNMRSLNRVPASAGVRAGMSPLPGGR